MITRLEMLGDDAKEKSSILIIYITDFLNKKQRQASESTPALSVLKLQRIRFENISVSIL
jgi:hypothetical protein